MNKFENHKESSIEENLRKLFYAFGTEPELIAVDIMIAQEIETIEELNERIIDELDCSN